MPKIIAPAVDHNDVAKGHVHVGVALEELGYRRERSRQVLLVAIEIGQDLSAGPPQPAIDGVVHPLVRLDERPDPPVLRQPVQRAVIGTGVLHDMFHLDLLVRYRSHAEPQPSRTAIAGCDNRDAHRPKMRARRGPVDGESSPPRAAVDKVDQERAVGREIRSPEGRNPKEIRSPESAKPEGGGRVRKRARRTVRKAVAFSACPA
jgi:hypothetical protein